MEDYQALSAMPLFDSADLLLQGNPVVNNYITQLSLGKVADAGLLLEHATDWLYEQRDSENNYKAYRSELTTFFSLVFRCRRHIRRQCGPTGNGTLRGLLPGATNRVNGLFQRPAIQDG